MPAESERPVEQCPGCGCDLPETTPGPDGHWYVIDGDALGCGCAGQWSADGEGAWPNHCDEECMRCAGEEIDELRERCARLEREMDAYKKAKAENDERFMRERDEARDVARELRLAMRSLASRANAHASDAFPWDGES